MTRRTVALLWALAAGCSVVNEFDEVDATPPCAGDPCDLLSQCGCDGDLMCAAFNDSIECFEAGLLGDGDECTALNCGPGLTCTSAFGSVRCHPWCDDDTQCDPGVCGVELEEPGPYRLCGDGCDPFTSMGCDASDRCYPLLGGTSRGYLCGPAGAGVEGTMCDQQSDCGANLACFNSACRAFCLVNGNPCPMGTTCRAFDPSVVYESSALGACVP